MIKSILASIVSIALVGLINMGGGGASPTHTQKTLMLIKVSAAISVSANGPHTINLGITLKEGDKLTLHHQYAATSERSSQTFTVAAGTAHQWAPWPATSEIHRVVFPATLNQTVLVTNDVMPNGNPSTKIVGYEVARYEY